MTNAPSFTRPATTLVALGDNDLSGLAARLGLESEALADTAECVARQQTAILVRPPAAKPFSSTSDHDLQSVEALFFALVHVLQRITLDVRDGREDAHHSVAILVPSDVALGTRNAVLPALLTGAVLSFVRTIAIELKKDAITVNTILYGDLDDQAEASSICSLLETYRVATTLTGQETYTASGPNLGRIKP